MANRRVQVVHSVKLNSKWAFVVRTSETNLVSGPSYTFGFSSPIVRTASLNLTASATRH